MHPKFHALDKTTRVLITIQILEGNAILKLAQEQGQDRGQVTLPFPDRIIPIPKGHAGASQNMLKSLY